MKFECLDDSEVLADDEGRRFFKIPDEWFEENTEWGLVCPYYGYYVRTNLKTRKTQLFDPEDGTITENWELMEG